MRKADFTVLFDEVEANGQLHLIRLVNIIGGGIKTINQISYFEETNNGTVFNSDNGKPYFIRDYVTPIKSITGLDDYLFKEESNKILDFWKIKEKRKVLK